MRYEIPFMWHTSGAKNKGIIPAHVSERYGSDVEWVIVEADSDAAAYAAVVNRFASTRDKRPISGKSYVRNWRAVSVSLNNGFAPLGKLPRHKVGDRIVLHVAHADHRIGVIDEVLGEHEGLPIRFGIRLDDYPNIADFTLREFAGYGPR